MLVQLSSPARLTTHVRQPGPFMLGDRNPHMHLLVKQPLALFQLCPLLRRSIADVIMQQYGADRWGDFKVRLALVSPTTPIL